MSIESARAYVDKMKNDENFRNKVLACENAEKRMEFVKTQGFDFSQEEINSIFPSLSNGDLQRVAGGITNSGCSFPPRDTPPLCVLCDPNHPTRSA